MSKKRREEATILLADDEECLRNLTHTVLEDRGYNALTASNATEALRFVKEFDGHIDLLPTDMQMPDMEGPELAVKFRKSFPLSSVIFITAYVLDEVEERIPNEVILSKPFCIEALCDSVHQVLNQDP